MRIPSTFDFVPLHSASVSTALSSSPSPQHSDLVFLDQSLAVSVCLPSAPSFVLFSFELRVLTILTEKFFFLLFLGQPLYFFVATSYDLSLTP